MSAYAKGISAVILIDYLLSSYFFIVLYPNFFNPFLFTNSVDKLIKNKILTHLREFYLVQLKRGVEKSVKVLLVSILRF